MAKNNTICLLETMDRLWFHQIILFSEPNDIIVLSNNLDIPEEIITLKCPSSISPLSNDKEEDTSSTQSSVTTSKDEYVKQDDDNEDEDEYEKIELVQRSNSSLSLDQAYPKHMYMLRSYSGPILRLPKTMSYKTLLELELEEVKGFMDLGFKFNKDNLSPITMSVLPGLQRLKRLKYDKAQYEAQDNEYMYEEGGDDNLEENNIRVMRPYLSEAWLIKKPNSPLLNFRLPRAFQHTDMKLRLRYWAKTVASVVQQES